MIAALLLSAAALSAPSLEQGQISLGAEGRPDAWGLPGWRGSLDLDATSVSDAWSMSVAADLRGGTWLTGLPGNERLLRRLALRYDDTDTHLAIGRQQHLDARGFLPLDGLSVEVGEEGPSGAAVWVGRPWAVDTGAGVGVDLLAGAELRLRSEGPGWGLRPSWALGAEFRQTGADSLSRAHLAMRSSSLHGQRLDLLAELGQDPTPEAQGRGAARLDLRGSTPLARRWDAGASLRWEDLPPPATAGPLDSPLAWLAPEGYGRAELFSHGSTAIGAFSLSGGPIWRPHSHVATTQGAVGMLGWHGAQLPLELALRAAAVGPSWLAGGSAGGRFSAAGVEWTGAAGVYRLTGLDARAAWVGELRADGEVALWSGEDGGEVSLRAAAAGGADRLLRPWWRGGLVITALAPRGGA